MDHKILIPNNSLSTSAVLMTKITSIDPLLCHVTVEVLQLFALRDNHLLIKRSKLW